MHYKVSCWRVIIHFSCDRVAWLSNLLFFPPHIIHTIAHDHMWNVSDFSIGEWLNMMCLPVTSRNWVILWLIYICFTDTFIKSVKDAREQCMWNIELEYIRQSYCPKRNGEQTTHTQRIYGYHLVQCDTQYTTLITLCKETLEKI